MIIYVIIAFVAILIGMAISVSAFGTGGKRKKIFQDIYFSVEDVDGIGVLYTKTGEYSAILKMENPVQKYSANIDSYYEFNHLVTALAQTLGEGYAIHKQDVFVRKQFQDESNDNHEFLSESYFKYFNGRSYTDSQTYLIITQENKKSRIFSFDSKKWRDFVVKIRKVKDQLKDSGVEASYLDGNTAREYVDRYFSMNFNDKVVSMTNFKVDEESICMGNKRCKVYSLVDVDCVSTPSIVRPFTNIEVNNVSMPVDMVSLVDCIPSADVVVYNQMFFIPNQKRELSLLDKKKNRHASMPNPSNQIAVEDIKKVQDVIARENKQLVYAHFNLVVGTSIDADIQKCTNHLENSFGRLGIHISKRAYNQLELFVNSDYVVNYYRGEDAIFKAKECIENGLPAIISVVNDNKNIHHTILAIGTEYKGEKDKEKLLKLFCLDPAYIASKTTYWNCIIDTGRTYSSNHPYWYITDKDSCKVNILEIITFDY